MNEKVSCHAIGADEHFKENLENNIRKILNRGSVYSALGQDAFAVFDGSRRRNGGYPL